MDFNKTNLSILTIGFKFEKSFRIGDVLGNIFDTILSSEVTPFSTKFFPSIIDKGFDDRAFFNPEKGHYLKITTSDIIFKFHIDKDKDLNEEINWFTNDAVSFIIDKIIKDNNISNFIRIGIMFSHYLKEPKIGAIVASKLADKKLDDITSFNLVFGRKVETIEGLSRKKVNDYRKLITTIKQLPDNAFDITLDYQHHFNPKLSRIQDWKMTSFIEKAKIFLEEDFLEFVNVMLSSESN